MIVTMVDPEGTILREIEDHHNTRDDVAITYAQCLRASGLINWARINRAIMDRWSLSALSYIKTKAWKIREGKG